ncbi:uncharacterized protein [Polyergus mexicanus]|uniref:uncharacterized protein n=1 Tax=Polyergus mexicanus TaxID=615972 RepID=UPI0038B5B68C
MQQYPDAKYPILLPANHPFTHLVIAQEHQRQLHAGAQATLTAANPRTSEAIMSELPSYRVTPSKPFTCSGVDYGGPFHIKSGQLRNAKFIKAYIAIFVCLATNAVHIELQHVNQIYQYFWKRWNHEYLQQLQERTKWQLSKGLQPNIGDMVMMRENEALPLKWLVGRENSPELGSRELEINQVAENTLPPNNNNNIIEVDGPDINRTSVERVAVRRNYSPVSYDSSIFEANNEENKIRAMH